LRDFGFWIADFGLGEPRAAQSVVAASRRPASSSASNPKSKIPNPKFLPPSRRHPLAAERLEKIDGQQHVALGIVELHDADLKEPHGQVAVGAIAPGNAPPPVDQDRFVKAKKRD
jgi:hypothetical protein